jgi:biliverdin reductase
MQWGLIGAGRAGRARARAIDADPRANLIGWHRGSLDHPTARQFSELGDLLRQVEAVAVCSPSGFHRRQVQQALEADCHVLCEFPLALSAADAEQLFASARRSDKVLHVEHIGLLTPTAKWLRQRVQGRELWGGAVSFSSPGGRWLEDEGLAGSIAHRNLSRLHRVIDLFGVPGRVSVSRRSRSLLDATLGYRHAEIALEFRQEQTLDRVLSMTLTLSDGVVALVANHVWDGPKAVPLTKTSGLFLADQLMASSAMLDQAPLAVPSDRIIQVLSIADRLANVAISY